MACFIIIYVNVVCHHSLTTRYLLSSIILDGHKVYFKKYHFLFRVLSTSSMQNQNGVQQKLSRWKEETVDMASVLLAPLL